MLKRNNRKRKDNSKISREEFLAQKIWRYKEIIKSVRLPPFPLNCLPFKKLLPSILKLRPAPLSCSPTNSISFEPPIGVHIQSSMPSVIPVHPSCLIHKTITNYVFSILSIVLFTKFLRKIVELWIHNSILAFINPVLNNLFFFSLKIGVGKYRMQCIIIFGNLQGFRLLSLWNFEIKWRC